MAISIVARREIAGGFALGTSRKQLLDAVHAVSIDVCEHEQL
jgi:hypothetical protein